MLIAAMSFAQPKAHPEPAPEGDDTRPGGRDRNPRLPTDAAREALMIQAAKLFFRLDRSQTEIAQDLGLTRWQVSRLLAEARESGVVRIEICPRGRRLPELEAALQAGFGLREAVVVAPAETEAQTGDAVARAAASYLAGLGLRDGLLGVSWGRTMAAVARALPANWAPGVHVVQVNGAVALRAGMAGTNSAAELFAASAPGRATMLPAPAILGQAQTRMMLERDRVVSDVLRLADRAQTQIFTFGAAGPDSLHVASGYIDPQEMAALQARGAVGDVLGRFIDARGAIADADLDARTLGLPLASLRGRDRAIGVCSGRGKHDAALAGLRARLANVLITDADTARHVLAALACEGK